MKHNRLRCYGVFFPCSFPEVVRIESLMVPLYRSKTIAPCTKRGSYIVVQSNTISHVAIYRMFKPFNLDFSV